MRNSSSTDSAPPTGLGRRHLTCFLAFLGFVNVYALRVNLSVALVAMVNQTAIRLSNNESNSENHTSSECLSTNSTLPNKGEFVWDSYQQGLILGAFFYGYIITQLPGGYLAQQFGAKQLFGLGVLCTSVLTILTPLAAHLGLEALIAIRVLEGFGEGVTFPAMQALWSKWAPPLERSKLIGFSFSGAHIGTVVSLPISGYLCQLDFAGGWPLVFYIFGALGCLWYLYWVLLVFNSPQTHPYISSSEKAYIEQSIGRKHFTKPPTPWLSILASPAVWAVTICHTANNWQFYTLLTCLPTYMQNILGFDIQQDGFLSAIPYFVLFLVQSSSGQLADNIRSRRILSTKTVRKLMSTVALVGSSSFLIATGYIGCNRILQVVLITISTAFGGLNMGAGFQCNHLDIAPAFAGVLMGITNTMATIPGFVSPLIVGALTKQNETRGQWQLVFYISSAVSLFGAVFYLIFAEGQEQLWAAEAALNKRQDIDSDLHVPEDQRSLLTNEAETCNVSVQQ